MSQWGTDGNFFIPDGREVIITDKNNENIFAQLPNAHLIYDEELELNIKSNYGSIVETTGSNLLSLLGGSFTVGGANVPSGQFALQGLQIWKETEPLTFSLNVSLYTVASAYSDVIRPALHLASLTVPSTTKEDGTQGWNLIPPGPNIADILNEMGGEAATLATSLQNGKNFIKLKSSQGIFNVKIGNYMTIPGVIIIGVSPTFSNILMDEDGALVPMSCKIQLEMSTARVATKEMLQEIFSSWGM
jgi:hypothetical protein